MNPASLFFRSLGLAAVMVLSACATSPGGGVSMGAAVSGTDPLAQSHWTLAQWIQPGGGARPLPGLAGDRPLTMAFTLEQGQPRVSGFSGCNRYMGGYVYANGLLIVKAPAGTRMACRSPEHTRLEQDFLTALVSITASQLAPPQAPTTLRLTTQAGDTLIFTRGDEPLVGDAGRLSRDR